VLVITAPRGNPAAKQSYTETVENRSGAWDREPPARKKEPFFDDNKDIRKKDSFFDTDMDLQRKGSFFEDSENIWDV